VTAALGFAAFAMLAAYLAARWGAGIPDRSRLLLFVGVMLTAAIVMWRRALRPATEGAPPVHGAAPRPALLAAAVAVGVLTGLVGVGGGFLIVPALVGVLAMPMAEAAATSLAVIALNTAAAGMGWWGRVTLDLPLTAAVTAMALLGMLVGTRLAPRFSARALTRAFAALLVLVSALMVVMER
jgi:uncharacterized membrane protein YfcA